ncbi:MAG: hypothetical protein IID44_01015 [Planctomycetes bacterium]|nr:hypothetical protein [Planctomycetota bacterium]
MAEHFPLPCWDAPPGGDFEPTFLGEPEPAGESLAEFKKVLDVAAGKKLTIRRDWN